QIADLLGLLEQRDGPLLGRLDLGAREEVADVEQDLKADLLLLVLQVERLHARAVAGLLRLGERRPVDLLQALQHALSRAHRVSGGRGRTVPPVCGARRDAPAMLVSVDARGQPEPGEVRWTLPHGAARRAGPTSCTGNPTRA